MDYVFLSYITEIPWADEIDRVHVLHMCRLWCKTEGKTFIQADFELGVLYYEENENG